MNLAEFKVHVFRMTNHTFNDTFHMRDLINSALTMLSDEAKLEGIENYYLSAGLAEYPLPSYYKSPRLLIEGTTDNPVQVYNSVTIDESRQGYAIWDGNIVIKPTPDQDKTLTFYFYKYPVTLVEDTDETESAFDGYVDVIAAYASSMILSLPGAVEVTKGLIDRYFAIWEEGKRRFKADRAKQNKQSAVRTTNRW